MPGSASPLLEVVSQYGAGGASSRVRVLDWLDHLGLHASVHDYIGASNSRPATLLSQPLKVALAEFRLRGLARRASSSVVLISRQASPFSQGHIERHLLRAAARGIYDFDDALMVSGTRRPTNKALAWATSVRNADLVIAGSDYLAARAEEAGAARTVMIPSCVDPDGYARKVNYELSEPPVAVWLGSPYTEDYLSLIAKPLLKLHETLGLRLKVISAGHRPLGELQVMTDRVEWELGLPEAALADSDLGIMPLRSDAWAEGKCAYKILQYAAAGLPVVASPIGANRLALERLGGFAAETAADWIDSVTALVTASALDRRQAGDQARNGVEEHYSFKAWSGVWKRAVLG